MSSAGVLSSPFRVLSVPTTGLDGLLPARAKVGTGNEVFTRDGRPIHLGPTVGSGGEGIVYRTDRGDAVCKIYHPARLTEAARRKVELMVTRRTPDLAVCWPTEAVYDTGKVFRGFVMPAAAGEPLGRGLFVPAVWQKKRPNWTRRESVRLALTVLGVIDRVHRLNVLLGDINPQNVLVRDERTASFVDCDSYQVEGFPCPVGSVNFTAPELQGRPFGTLLRTLEHELFAVATLLFMIVVPGKCPYSHQGGADGAENIRTMHFPYRLQGQQDQSEGVPEGAWRFCWSHLDRQLREAFFRSFHHSHRGKPRVTVAKWQELFAEYGWILDKPDQVFTGPTPQYGFDLSLLPQSKRYLRDMGEPPPADGVTGVQQRASKLARELAQARADAGLDRRRPTPDGARRPTGWNPPPTPWAPTPLNTTTAPTNAAWGWLANPILWAAAAALKVAAELAAGGLIGGLIGLAAGWVGWREAERGDAAGILGGVGLLAGLCASGWCVYRSVRAMRDVRLGVAVAAGVVVGAVGLPLFAGSAWWGIPGGIVGLAAGLLVWRLSDGPWAAGRFIRRWWWIDW